MYKVLTNKPIIYHHSWKSPWSISNDAKSVLWFVPLSFFFFFLLEGTSFAEDIEQ